jgi:hypothetical protein
LLQNNGIFKKKIWNMVTRKAGKHFCKSPFSTKKKNKEKKMPTLATFLPEENPESELAVAFLPTF